MKKLSLLLALSAVAGAAHATLVFDNLSNVDAGVTGANITVTTSTPNTFMGDGYILSAGTTSLTGFDIVGYNNTTTTYTGVQATIYVWGTVNMGTVSATSPAFSNLLGAYTVTDTTDTFAPGGFIDFEGSGDGTTPAITLATPLAIPSTTIGLTISYAGTTNGTTFATANNLTSLISYGTAPTTGGQVFNGYYRNAGGETNGNFTSTLRSLNLTNQSLSVRVFGNVQAVPEPAAFAPLALGLVAVLRRRNRKA